MELKQRQVRKFKDRQFCIEVIILDPLTVSCKLLLLLNDFDDNIVLCSFVIYSTLLNDNYYKSRTKGLTSGRHILLKASLDGESVVLKGFVMNNFAQRKGSHFCCCCFVSSLRIFKFTCACGYGCNKGSKESCKC